MTPARSDAVILLLTDLARSGIEIEALGDRIRYRPRSAMSEELAARIRLHRKSLLAVLVAATPAPAPSEAPTPETVRRRWRLDDVDRAVLDVVRSSDGAGSARVPSAPDAVWVSAATDAASASSAKDADYGVEPAKLPPCVLDLAAPKAGWTPPRWRDRLLQLAERCEAINPQRAAELRLAAIYMTPAWRERYDERAATLGLNSSFPRELAERDALKEIVASGLLLGDRGAAI